MANNITVKNGSNVDKTFTLLSPAAGYGSIAAWALKEGVISTIFPKLTVTAMQGPNSSSAHIKITLPSSYQDAVTGLTVVKNRAEANLKLAIPADFPEALKDDWLAYVTNLLKSPELAAAIRDALPRT